MRLATGLLPAVLAIAATLAILGYNLDVDRHRNIVRELNSRRSQGAVSSAYGVDSERVLEPALGDSRDLLLRPRERGVLPVVTIFEREGSGASDIGPAVAEELGVRYVGQKFSSDDVAQVEVHALTSDNAFDRWLRAVSWTGTQDSDMARALDHAEDHTIAEQNRRELLELAQDGAVIRGRNGAYVLGRAVGGLHVRLTAPLPMRLVRVMAKTCLDREAARKRIAVEDHVRAEMSRNLYQWDPHTDEYYDLVINTGTVTYKQVVEMIVGVYRSKYPTTSPQPATTDRPTQDPTRSDGLSR